MRLIARRSIAVLILCCVTLGTFIALNASAATRTEKREQIQSDLKNAAVAEESYRTTHDGYTRVLNHLKSNGFEPNPRVALIIVRGDEEYCLEAQHTAMGEIWHYSSTVGRPQNGRC